jgi:hypothetical protein
MSWTRIPPTPGVLPREEYVIEQDPPVEPFSFAAESFEYVNRPTF